MNGAGKSESIERVYSVEDHAVFALTQLMTLYLDKNTFEKQRVAEAKSSDDFCSDEDIAAAQDLPANALQVLEHPVPGALKNGMREIGTALYRETKSTDAMSDVLYRVIEKFPNRDQEVIDVLDHAFHGIGGWWA